MIAHSFFLKNDRKQHEEKLKPYPPLATLHAASFLRASGYSISFFDAQLAGGMIDFFTRFSEVKPDILVLYEDDFNFLTKMCLSHVRNAALEMIKFSKNQTLKIIVHSADATDHPLDYLTAGADYIIGGEGEESLLELVNCLSSSQRPPTEKIAGLTYYDDHKLVKTARRPTMKCLEHLPQPAWDLVDFKSYKDIWNKYHDYFSLNMVTTRGCPYKCNWCSKPIWGQQYVSHSPKYILNQLEILIARSQPDHIWFTDDIFGLKKGWVEEFAYLITSQAIDIAYSTQTRADLVTDKFAKALEVSGCKQIWLGVESGSQSILDSMDKGITLEQVKQARTLLKEKAIEVGFFIQLGYIGEDIEQINATRNMILTLQPEEIGVSVSYPLPGTKFYDSLKVDLLNNVNWQESGDLSPTFASTFDADFYKQVRDHLHGALKNLNEGKENSLLNKEWHDLMDNCDQYRNIESQTAILNVINL